MTNPTIIDIPHKLGKAEATRRMKARVGDLPSYIPGGVATVKAEWPAADRMALDVQALGQAVTGTLDVGEDRIRATLMLPPMLAMLSGKITDVIQRKGGALLLGQDD